MQKRKQIYSFDFDGTLCKNKYPEIGKPIVNVIEFAKQVKSEGHYIILNTMRENESLEAAIEWCKSQGIIFDAINDNLPHMKEFFKNNPRKIFANYYIDDHNLFFYDINDKKSNSSDKYLEHLYFNSKRGDGNEHY
jgi:hydroxymethylpyrimidine pyrophosphatase-like HAD family hydrolase